MAPTLIYKKAFMMEDGTPPDLTLDKSYEVVCSYTLPGNTFISLDIIDDANRVHSFDLDIDREWFNLSFDLLGDIQEVWEEI